MFSLRLFLTRTDISVTPEHACITHQMRVPQHQTSRTTGRETISILNLQIRAVARQVGKLLDTNEYGCQILYVWIAECSSLASNL